MKSAHKNLTSSGRLHKLGHVSNERIRSVLRLKKLNGTLNHTAVVFNSSIIGSNETKENEVLMLELELKRNQARTYAGVVPPR
jgi:hypothetical protein